MIRWRTELPVLIAVFLDLLGFGMIIADFQLRGEALMPRNWPTGLVIGLMLASTFAIQIVMSPRWGVVSDRVGRKPILLVCSVLSATAMLVYGLADSIWLLFLSRLLAGFGGANVAIAQALIGDEVPEEGRTAAIGRIGAAISAGLIVGPATGGFLAAVGANHLVGFIAGSASTLGLIAIWLMLPNRPASHKDQVEDRQLGLGLRLLREVPALTPFFLIAAVSWFSLAMLEGTFARLIKDLFGYDQRQFGFLFSYEALVGVIIQGIALAWITRRIKSIHLLRIAYVLQGIGLALNPLAGLLSPPLILLFVASSLFALGGSVSNPTINATCSTLVPSARQGELFGLLQSARSVGFLVGPMVGGVLFDYRPPLPYLIAGGVCLVAAMLVPMPRVAPQAVDVIET